MSGIRRFAALPGIGAALLPIGTCPACWPAYAGLLGSLGLGFLLDVTYLLPLTVGLFALALFALAWRASTRRGYRPFVVGLLGSAIALTGKFVLLVDPLVYVGVAGLLVASVWNGWPRRVTPSGSCASCASTRQTTNLEAHDMEVRS